MSYKSLYRLYLMNNDDVFSNIYKNRFNSDSTIKFDLYINDYQSFFYYDKEIMGIFFLSSASISLINISS